MVRGGGGGGGDFTISLTDFIRQGHESLFYKEGLILGVLVANSHEAGGKGTVGPPPEERQMVHSEVNIRLC